MAAKRCADLPVPPRDIATVESMPRCDLPDIPDDLIFNILARLPAKSVIRFKSVCKAWLAMLSSRRFVDAHLEFSMARPTMLVVPAEYHQGERGWRTAYWMGFYKYSGGDVAELVHGEHLPGGFGELSHPLHCDGLILNYTRGQELMVCNPATREFVSLPKGTQSESIFHKVGFGHDPCSNEYKVVRFFYQRKDGTAAVACRFEVLTLGTNVWRRTVDPPYPITRAILVHVRGFIYFGVFPGRDLKVIVRFSLADETFSLLTLYPPCKDGYACLIELEGELCFVFIAKPCEAVEFWIFCNTMDMPTWTLRYTVRLPQETVTLDPRGFSRPPKVTFHGKDLLIIGNHKMYQYSIETEETKKVAVAIGDLLYYHPENNRSQAYMGKEFHTVSYAESLVQVRGHNSSVKRPVFSLLARIVDHAWNLLISYGWQNLSRH